MTDVTRHAARVSLVTGVSTRDAEVQQQQKYSADVSLAADVTRHAADVLLVTDVSRYAVDVGLATDIDPASVAKPTSTAWRLTSTSIGRRHSADNALVTDVTRHTKEFAAATRSSNDVAAAQLNSNIYEELLSGNEADFGRRFDALGAELRRQVSPIVEPSFFHHATLHTTIRGGILYE
jgi:hypothetical protein